jgi:GGDEF domain-containing protein
LIPTSKSAEQSESLEKLCLAMTDCYSDAIQSSAQYAVEVDPAQAARFRRRMNAIGERWRAANDPGELRVVAANFRGELRVYQGVAEGSLKVLRREVRAAAEAIAAFAGGLASHGADHEEQLKQALERLSSAAASDDLAHIRCAIQAAIVQIHAALEQMRMANRMVVTQLQDEIRVLHDEIDDERLRYANPALLLRTRKQMEQKINVALSSEEPFCLLLIAVSNWKAAIQGSASAAKTVIDEMIGRLHTAVDPDLIVGRWSEEEFIAILRVDPATALACSRDAAIRLSGSYEIEDNGERRTVELEVNTGVIDRGAGSGSPGFRSKLAALASALSRA